MTKRLCVCLLVALITAGCGNGNTTPTGPTGPPAAAFSIAPEGVGMVGVSEYRFNAGGSSDPDRDALTYSWDFGDGNTGSGEITTHVYNRAGNFVITLTVSDGTGSTTATTSATVGRGFDGDALLIAIDGVMAAATSEARAFFGELDPSFSEGREELYLSQFGEALSGYVSLFGMIRGGTFDPQSGYLGSQGFAATPIVIDGSIATSSDGGCPCPVRLSGSTDGVSYSLSGTVDANGNRIASDVEIRSSTSFFPAQTGSSTYERR